ncbi:MAG: hypothetical protein PHV65_02215, partial [Bacteroidales bacterium]|nr:hypothetical protein [Bacteroidales bacterium]
CKVCKTCEFYLIHSAKISKIYDLTFCLLTFNTEFYLATVFIMEIILISLAAFLTAILTFFSGFGLGTILMPVFAIFFQ